MNPTVEISWSGGSSGHYCINQIPLNRLVVVIGLETFHDVVEYDWNDRRGIDLSGQAVGRLHQQLLEIEIKGCFDQDA